MGWEVNLRRRIMHIGGSSVITIPPPVIRELELQAGDYVAFKPSHQGLMFLRGDMTTEQGVEYKKVTRFSKTRKSVKVTIPWRFARHFRPARHAEFFRIGWTWVLRPGQDS